MEPSLETSLETLNLTGQQQPSILDVDAADELEKILAGFNSFSESTPGPVSNSFDSNISSDQFDISALINSSSNDTDTSGFLQTQFSTFSIDSDEILGMLDAMESKQEPIEYPLPPLSLPPLQEEQQYQSTFIENYDQYTYYQPSSTYQSISSVPIGSTPIEPKAIDNLIYTQAFVNEQNEIYKQATKSKKQKGHHHQKRSTTVAPVDHIIHSGGCQPCTTAQVQMDYAYQQQLLEYDAADSKRIQIRSQPREKFRPRTHNESKTSSHYLRCEEGVKPEYPTVHIPRTWLFQSDVNLIEVALMDLDKQPHPYTLDNKTKSDTFEDNALIFKQNDPNVLYFRLTNEDFENGYKTFMIELIKSKQDDVITKEVIRARKLEHSMLRFTRIFQVGKGNFQRDDGSEEYSSVMSEAYGDVDVEHMGPRCGPMSGQEMVYIVLKGRILKNDLNIQITENLTGWTYSVTNFTKNGNVVYFIMPAFPYSLQLETIKVNICIYYKGEELSQSPYLYKGSLDEEFAELRVSDPTTTTSPTTSNSFDLFNFVSATAARPNSSSRRPSTTKRTTKRLINNK